MLARRHVYVWWLRAAALQLAHTCASLLPVVVPHLLSHAVRRCARVAVLLAGDSCGRRLGAQFAARAAGRPLPCIIFKRGHTHCWSTPWTLMPRSLTKDGLAFSVGRGKGPSYEVIGVSRASDDVESYKRRAEGASAARRCTTVPTNRVQWLCVSCVHV